MIDRMTKYSFILLSGEKEDFMERLRTLGVVDITRGSRPVDETSEKMLSDILERKTLISDISKGKDPHLEELGTKINELQKELTDVIPWGEYDLERLKALGYDVHFYRILRKDFNPTLADSYAIRTVSEDKDHLWLVLLGENEGFPFKEIPTPRATASVIASEMNEVTEEFTSYQKSLEARRNELPLLNKELGEMESDFSTYLAGLQGISSAEGALLTYEGFAPSEKDEELQAAFDDIPDVFYFKESAKAGDNPPIKFSNNRFVRMFEPLTDMYGRPAYDGFDPTPYISIFFLLFFAMCMGDAGYGIILILAGLFLRKVRNFASLAPLVTTLGAGTVIVGFFFHTFFSMDISQWEWIPDSVKHLFVPSKVAGYDGTMVLALAVGIIHLCLAMTLKAIYAIRNNGFVNSLGVLGWTVLIVGSVVAGTFAIAGVINTGTVKIIIISLGILSAIGIFLLNDIHRNPLLNIGSGLWETYNTATGILGDVLSYLRLYALGLAGSMLGFAFNDLAGMALGDGGAIGWTAFILIIVIGHTLNLAMAALGAFVHPLRLNFLEFFKNSGYEGSGSKYNPITK